VQFAAVREVAERKEILMEADVKKVRGVFFPVLKKSDNDFWKKFL
jgi:hypothetical protein